MPRISRWRRMQIPVIAWAVYRLVRLIGPTLRFEFLGKRNAVNRRESGQASIGAFWHRCIFPTLWYYRDHGIVVMITMNFDGLWTSRVVEKLGYRVAQGSSSRGGMNALNAMAHEVEAGWDVAFTPDGPRGPRYVAKPGPVMLARRTGKPVTVFYIGLSSAYTFEKSWDRFRLPYPFSRAVLVMAPPIYVSTDANSNEMERKISEMQSALERVRDVAESWFQLSEAERQQLREEWNEAPVISSAGGVSS
jgi:lysophospholipid acyltransferase (LPLAT)-like uncharacterized protein